MERPEERGKNEMRRKGVMTVALMALLAVAAFLIVKGSSAQSSKTLKIGSVLPLNFGMGVDTKNMLEMLLSKFNEEGGLTVNSQRVAFELIVYDDKWTAEAGRAAVERLVYQDKVKFIISQIASPTIVAGLSITESEKVLSFCSGTTLKIVDPKNRFTFGTSTTRTSLPPLWLMVKKIYPNAKTVVFICPNDEGGRTRATEEKQVAESFGLKVLDTLYYPRTAVDFSSIAVKAKSLNPDLVDYPGADTGTQFGLQIKAVHAAGFRGGQISAINPKMAEVTAVAGNDALEGLVCKMPDTELPNPPPLAKAVKEDYVKKYGKWSDASIPWIPAWYAFLAAVKKANSLDTEAIADVVATQGLQWQRPDGAATMVRRPDLGNSRYCDSCAEAAYGQVKNGKLEPTGRISLTDVIGACEKVFGGNWK
jgi:branched-chain amino acid transport system substrate-binding protein